MIRSLIFLALIAPAALAQERRDEKGPGLDRLKSYLEKGMPTPDRPWSAREYETASNLLAAWKAENVPLPRLRDDPSGGGFARLIDPENLRALDDKTLPIQQRFVESLKELTAVNKALTVYLVLKDEKQPYGAEVLEIVLFEMRVIDFNIRLADAFMASLTEAQRNEPIRQQGMAQMRAGYAQVVGGAFIMAGETKQYSEEDLRGFVGRFPDRLPPLLDLLSPESRAEFRKKAEDQARAHADPAIRSSMDRLVKAIDARSKSKAGRPG